LTAQRAIGLVFLACSSLVGIAWAIGDEALPIRPVLHVGIEQGDLRGSDQRVLQAAIDYLANLGGGTVRIGPGRYALRNSLRLRSGVTLVGAGEKSVLVLQPGGKTLLAADVRKGGAEITLVDASGFELGDAVALEDKAGHGFEVTTATLSERLSPRSFRLSEPAQSDYLLSRNAEVKRVCSGVAGWNVKNAAVESLSVEGNFGSEGSEYLGGCRGGGIYLFGCENVVVKNCSVRKYNGDAISFQGKCRHVTIENCLCEHNANVGMHPGSGSRECLVRKNILRNNGYVGLFVCVAVRHTQFLDNEIHDNAGCGISIGFEDSDNLFRGNRVINNAETGVLFRRDSKKAVDGAHRNVFEANVIRDNLRPRPAKSNSRPTAAGQAAVVIEGAHHGLVFRNNHFVFTKPHAGSAFLVDPEVNDLKLGNNRLHNIERLTVEYGP